MKAPPKAACRTQLEHAIGEWVVLSLNADRDREIMRRRLVDGAPVEKLTEEFELTEQRIKAIIDKWYDVIFEHIE
jgi:hypothetical protein